MKIMRTAIISCLMVTTLASLSNCAPKERVKVNEGEFIDAFLTDLFSKEIAGGTTLVIQKALAMGTIFPDDADYKTFAETFEKEGGDKHLLEAIEDFHKKNKDEHTLDSMELGVKHEPITKKKIEKLFSFEDETGWQIMERIYPGTPGIITISRPGFSFDGTLAIIDIKVRRPVNHRTWRDLPEERVLGPGEPECMRRLPRLAVLRKKRGKWSKSIPRK